MTTQDLRAGLKACSRCGRWLEPTAFPPNARLSSGLSSWCRACHVERTRQWRAEHPEAIAASNARRRVEPYPPRACGTCGGTFTPRRRDGRYCSPACKRNRRRAAADGLHAARPGSASWATNDLDVRAWVMRASGPTMPLFTIGYERHMTPAALIGRLEDAGIERLVDVRALPQSRRRGFSKKALSEALADVGIVYEHWGELGNPRLTRDLYRSGDIEAGREGYRAHVRNGASAAVDELVNSLGERATAVMCLEHEASVCHRRVLAEEIAARCPTVQVIDL